MKLAQWKDKRFRYGTFSTAMMLLAVLLFVFTNLFAGEFNHTWDLTQERLFTLSQASRDFLATLDEKVTLTLIAPTGTEEPIFVALLDEYANTSPFIDTALRDPLVNPGFVQQFATAVGGAVPGHSIIVQSSTQYRVITPDLMLTPQFNQQGHVIGIASINFERQITTAIHAVTLGEIATIYKVTGSGERALEPEAISFLETENFILRAVDALTLIRDGIPTTTDILLLSTPQWDWPTEKADRIAQFLDDGGQAMFVMSPQVVGRLPNVDRVLAAYGVRISDFVVMDPDPRQHIITPLLTIPLLWPHEINLPLAAQNRMTLFLSMAGAVETTDMVRATTTIEELLVTSVSAFGRLDLQLESPLYHEGIDVSGGRLMTAAAITDSTFDRMNDTRIVVIASSDILSSGAREVVGDNNFAFVASAMRWLAGQGPGLFIPVRTPGTSRLQLNQFEANMIAGFAMGVLPAVTLATGMFIWLRRRHS